MAAIADWMAGGMGTELKQSLREEAVHTGRPMTEILDRRYSAKSRWLQNSGRIYPTDSELAEVATLVRRIEEITRQSPSRIRRALWQAMSRELTAAEPSSGKQATPGGDDLPKGD
jgi:hypothetical protein